MANVHVPAAAALERIVWLKFLALLRIVPPNVSLLLPILVDVLQFECAEQARVYVSSICVAWLQLAGALHWSARNRTINVACGNIFIDAASYW